ncbi:ATP-binding protein [Peptoniphilus rachelemmaiella]|uniref:ATP-binding protein n=1 Tax=Peptoniphilus rachelemmaiella TaxID=2811779 RepID=UPI0020401B57|nr:ATP-binding protein [Peptoniphilus rachelemmaiella]
MEDKHYSSIKWRFIFIYVLLVLVVMAIIGAFIVNRLEDAQLEKVQTDMEQTLSSMANSSPYLTETPWDEVHSRIQNTLDAWRIGSDEAIYAIGPGRVPKIIASTNNSGELVAGQNALGDSDLSPKLILDGFRGEGSSVIREDAKTKVRHAHYTMPVFAKDGSVMGLFYMVSDLSGLYGVVDDARVIMTYAMVVAMGITTLLAYILARSITLPIRDVTRQAREMAEGNFNQKVEVKSNDEIGRLGSMFNYLTTELEETISRMDSERSKLDTMFHYMSEGIVAVDAMGRLVHVNPVAKEILDLADDAVGEAFDMKRLNIQKINYYDAGSLTGLSQIEIKNKFYNIRYAPYKGESKRPQGIIAVLQDITEEHNLDVLRKDFVANVGHELKTPITTIKSYTETLMTASLNRDAQLRFLGIIDRESDRMTHLVTDLLQLSNMDAKRTNWEPVSMDAYEVVTAILESLQPMIKERHHKVYLDIPVDIRPFLADKHGAYQVITNILTNAFKYTTYAGKIEVIGRNFGSRVHIQIKDNGIGIARSDLERIYERFYRVEKGRSRAMGGSGLGLSIAKDIMENMGGRIRIKSELNVGTEVLLSFPMDQEEA